MSFINAQRNFNRGKRIVLLSLFYYFGLLILVKAVFWVFVLRFISRNLVKAHLRNFLPAWRIKWRLLLYVIKAEKLLLVIWLSNEQAVFVVKGTLPLIRNINLKICKVLRFLVVLNVGCGETVWKITYLMFKLREWLVILFVVLFHLKLAWVLSSKLLSILTELWLFQ